MDRKLQVGNILSLKQVYEVVNMARLRLVDKGMVEVIMPWLRQVDRKLQVGNMLSLKQVYEVVTRTRARLSQVD